MKIIKIEWHKATFPNYALMVMDYFEPYIMLSCIQYQWRLPGYDLNDLAQELRLALWKSLKRYDFRKTSLRTWGNLVIKRKINNIQRDNFRYKRQVQYYLSELDGNKM